MLKIIEVSSAEQLQNKYVSGDVNNDYMYFLKYANTIMITDNGVDKYFNSIQECDAATYIALTHKENTFYLVSQVDESYKCYFKDIVIADTSLHHSHLNKTILDKFTINAGVLLYDEIPVDDKTDNHNHTNKSVIDKFSEAVDGSLLFDGNNYIVNPMDVKDDHEVEYIHMKSTNSLNSIVIPYTTLYDNKNILSYLTEITKSSNITLNPDFTITLKAGKVYEVEFAVWNDSVSLRETYTYIKDTTGKQYGNQGFHKGGNTPNYGSDIQATAIIEVGPDADIYIAGYIMYQYKVQGVYCYFKVKEIAQPVVVEYNKEISNPLTTTDISQESPVGSIILFSGTTAPTHYLKTDGVIYNISNYQELSAKIGNQFGGNGTTTFAVPNLSSATSGLIYCIKYESTYYAVNQYGGFDKSTIYIGNANSVGNYNLTDTIQNYDWLRIEFACNHSTLGINVYRNYIDVEVNDIVVGSLNQFLHTIYGTCNVSYSFNSNSIFSINSIGTLPANCTSVQVIKVVGYWGQLPTLLEGGVM